MLFLDSNKHWQSLTNKRTGEFLALKTLREKFGDLNIMKSVLSLDETPSALGNSFKAATKLSHELPTDLEMETIPLVYLSLVEDINVKTREFLGVNKALQGIKGELLKNMSKLTQINKINKSY